MSASNVLSFDYLNHEIVAIVEDTSVWFDGMGISEALEYRGGERGLTTRCLRVQELRNVISSPMLVRNCPDMLLIDIMDVSRLIVLGHREVAREFEAWFVDKVIPTINKKLATEITIVQGY